MIKDVVRHIMHEKSFDSAIDWLDSLTWDGVDRCSRLFSVYFGVEPSPYEQAVSEYFVTAMAGRVLTPGVQADMVPVLLGGQGIGKTSGVKALAPINDSFAEIDLSGRKDSDLARQLRGKLIGELGELRGLKTKDSEWIKAWITRTHEEWTPKFVEHSKNMPRRCVFLGTTNEDEFLIDVTGNRRWLPLRVISSCKPAQIKNDIEQIWAQAAAMYRKNSVMWELAAGLSESFQEEHTQHDDWAMDSIEEVLNMAQFATADGFKLKDVTDKLFPNIEVSRASQHRIADALRRQGYNRVTVKKDGKFTKAYKKRELENPF
jgi:predicted P-loop ATPase